MPASGRFVVWRSISQFWFSTEAVLKRFLMIGAIVLGVATFAIRGPALAFADPNNCSLPSGNCQSLTFQGTNLTILDGGIFRGPVVVGGSLTVNGTINGGVTGPGSLKLPQALILTDGGSVATMSALTVTSGATESLVLNAPRGGFLFHATQTGGTDVGGALVVQDNTGGGRSLVVKGQDGGDLFYVGPDFTLTNVEARVLNPTPPPSTNYLLQAVNLGTLDGGLWGTIPGKASGLAANSTALPGLIHNPTLLPDGGDPQNQVMEQWNFTDGGPVCQMLYPGYMNCTGESSTFQARSIAGGDYVTYPDFAGQFAGTVELYGSRPIIFNDAAFTPHAGIGLNTSNVLSVTDGSSPLTGGLPALLGMSGVVLNDSSGTTRAVIELNGSGIPAVHATVGGVDKQLEIANGTDVHHAAAIVQLTAVETTLSSIYVPTAPAVSDVLGAHRLPGYGTSMNYAVRAATGYQVGGSGTGHIVIKASDGTNTCLIATPACSTTGNFRNNGTNGTGTGCAYTAGSTLTFTVDSVTGTCATLPTYKNLDIVGNESL